MKSGRIACMLLLKHSAWLEHGRHEGGNTIVRLERSW